MTISGDQIAGAVATGLTAVFLSYDWALAIYGSLCGAWFASWLMKGTVLQRVARFLGSIPAGATLGPFFSHLFFDNAPAPVIVGMSAIMSLAAFAIVWAIDSEAPTVFRRWFRGSEPPATVRRKRGDL